MVRSLLFIPLLLFATAATAELKRLKEWDQSPVGAFMTRAEREEWKKLASDDAAARFISRFLARRGEDFEMKVLARLESADTFLLSQKLKPTPTVRWLLLLLGPPAEIRDGKMREKGALTPELDAGGAELTPRVSPGGRWRSVRTPENTWQHDTGVASRYYRLWKLMYPAGNDRPELIVHVEVDASKNDDRLTKETNRQELDARIEAAALATITKP